MQAWEGDGGDGDQLLAVRCAALLPSRARGTSEVV
jgi:hypothetical protein